MKDMTRAVVVVVVDGVNKRKKGRRQGQIAYKDLPFIESSISTSTTLSLLCHNYFVNLVVHRPCLCHSA